jgi:hypothetical protein
VVSLATKPLLVVDDIWNIVTTTTNQRSRGQVNQQGRQVRLELMRKRQSNALINMYTSAFKEATLLSDVINVVNVIVRMHHWACWNSMLGILVDNREDYLTTE